VFELDPSIRQKMTEQTQQRIERARLEMQWEKEKLALAHRKLHVSSVELFADLTNLSAGS